MDHLQRLDAAASRAKRAEAWGGEPAAAREWRTYRLIRDAGRDPEELLAEGIAFSAEAIKLASLHV